MRFAEVLELGPTNKLVNINDSVYEQLVDRWTREMGAKKLFGYKKETRVEHFQEAVDIIYTALEAELQTAEPGKILSHPKWILLVGCAKRNFPEHLSVYQPSPLEQTRVKRMVRNTLTTRIIANKIDLLDIIKKDKCDSTWTVGELAVSRLRYELLAASAGRVHDHYMKQLDSDWRTGYDWNQTRSGWYHSSGTVEAEAEKTATGFGKGVNGIKPVRAGGSGSFLATGQAGLSLDKEWKKEGFKQTLQGHLQARAAASGSASEEAKMSELMISAGAGLEAEASFRADIDYEMTYSCKLKENTFVVYWELRWMWLKDMPVAVPKQLPKCQAEAVQAPGCLNLTMKNRLKKN